MNINCAWCGAKLDSFSTQIYCSDWCKSILRKSLRLRNSARIHKFEKRFEFERDRKALECLEDVQASEERMGLDALYSPKRLIIRRQGARAVVKGLEWSGGSLKGSNK